MRSGSARRLLCYSVLLIVLASVLLVGGEALEKELNRRERTALLGKAVLVAGMLAPAYRSGDYGEVAILCGKASVLSGAGVVVAKRGGIIAFGGAGESRPENLGERPEISAAFSGRASCVERAAEGIGKATLYAAVPLQGRETGVVELWKPGVRAYPFLRIYYAWSVVVGLFFLLAAAALEVYLRAVVMSSVERLRGALRKIACGEHLEGLSSSPDDAMAPLYRPLDEAVRLWQGKIDEMSGRMEEVEALFDSMGEAVLVIDPEDRVIRSNRAAKELFNLQRVETSNRVLLQQLRCVGLDRFVGALREKDRDRGETLTYHRAGADLYLDVTGVAIRGEKTGEGEILLVFHDVTRLKKLERMRKEFVSNVSHELKTPITSIKGFVEALESGALDDPRQASEFLGIIARQTDRLSAIIEDLLKLSSIENSEGRVEILRQSLLPLLQRVKTACAISGSMRNVNIEVICPDDLEAGVNASLLEEALLNLLSNAVRYSKDGSSVRLGAGMEGKTVKLEVRDTGCGIPREHLPRLFERFYRVEEGRNRDTGGTGLGLAIVKHIVKAHGGTISVESELGEGSTFTILLPPPDAS